MKPFYVKYKFDCSDLIKQYCIDFLQKNWNFRESKIFRLDTNEKVFDCLKKEILFKNLPELSTMSIFCRGPYNRQIVHIDTVVNNGFLEKSQSNFYIPIFNNKGKIVWYDTEGGEEINTTTPAHANSNNKVTHVLMVKYKNPRIVCEYKENDPVIINTLIPHSGISFEAPRAALSFRVKGNINLFKFFNF